MVDRTTLMIKYWKELICAQKKSEFHLVRLFSTACVNHFHTIAHCRVEGLQQYR